MHNPKDRKVVASVARTIATATKIVGRADEFAKREMPETRKLMSFNLRKLNQKVIQPVVEPVQRSIVKGVHSLQDALEKKAASENRNSRNLKAKLQVDFKSATHVPPKLSRNTTTAVKSPTTGDPVKVKLNTSVQPQPKDPRDTQGSAARSANPGAQRGPTRAR